MNMKQAIPLVLFTGALMAKDCRGGTTLPNLEERKALKRLAERLPEARLVWNSNRTPKSGTHTIYTMTIKELQPRPLTGEDEFSEWYPRWSPEGERIVYTRCKLPGAKRPNHVATPENSEIWLMNKDGTDPKKLADVGFQAVWSEDGKAVFYKAQGYDIVRHDLETNKTTVLAAPGKGIFARYTWSWDTIDVRKNGRYLVVGLRLGQGRRPAVFDLEKQKPVGAVGDSCNASWAPGGTFVTHSGATHTIMISPFNPENGTLSPARKLIDLPGYQQEYKARVSNDDQWLVWSAWNQGEHDLAPSEVFLWKIGEPAANATRLTFDTATDIWPDLYVPQGGAAKK